MLLTFLRSMEFQYFGRERVCASFIDREVKGKTLNIGAGEVRWLENDIFLGNPSFVSSDLDPKNLGEKNLAKEKIVANAESLPFKEGEFSQVIILDVLEHTKNHHKVVEELHRVLKKNGRLVISVPNDTYLSYLNPIRYAQHERHYTIQHITSLLKSKGFDIEEVFAGGRIVELMHLYLHLLIKYMTGRVSDVAFLNSMRDREYSRHRPNGNEVIIKARKI